MVTQLVIIIRHDMTGKGVNAPFPPAQDSGTVLGSGSFLRVEEALFEQHYVEALLIDLGFRKVNLDVLVVCGVDNGVA